MFQKVALPKGELMFRGRRVDPAATRRAALLTMEGERADLCAIGPSLVAQDIASSLRANLRAILRTHCVQPNVGHHGLFSDGR